jgi:transcriptional regulator with XRE-family HTH domain
VSDSDQPTIRGRRLELGLPPEALADKSRVSLAHVRNAESGRSRDREAVGKIAAALEMSFDEAWASVERERRARAEQQKLKQEENQRKREERIKQEQEQFERDRTETSLSGLGLRVYRFDKGTRVSEMLAWLAGCLSEHFEAVTDLSLGLQSDAFRIYVHGRPRRGCSGD